MGLPRKKLLFLGGLTLSLVLMGCSTRTQQAQITTDDNQIFQKSVGQAQFENGEDDPLAMHLAARAQVNPRDLSSHHAYTTTPTREQIYSQENITVAEAPVSTLAVPEPVERQPVEVKPAQVNVAPQNITPAAGSALSEVTAVRIGRHPDKTRLVFDLSKPGKFSYDIDPSGRILSVRLPQSGWSAAPEEPGAGLVKSLHAAPAPEGGVAVNIELSRPGRLAFSGTLPPNEVYGDRIVFDVAQL